MIRLLASVIREEEVRAAIDGGADILDAKNPAEGSLGAPFPGTVLRMRELAPANVPVSVAIGDAPMLPGTMALAAYGAALCGVQYVKAGLFGPRDVHEAEILLTAIRRAVNDARPATLVMAAGYADAGERGGILPEELPGAAARCGANGCMLDTLAKGPGRSLFSVLAPERVEGFVASCRALGLTCALAGSLSLSDIPLLRRLGPDIVGVRSAICGGDRAGGSVDAAAVRLFKQALAGEEC